MELLITNSDLVENNINYKLINKESLIFVNEKIKKEFDSLTELKKYIEDNNLKPNKNNKVNGVGFLIEKKTQQQVILLFDN